MRDPLALTLGLVLIALDRAGGAVRARARVRSALPRLPVRAADRRGGAVRCCSALSRRGPRAGGRSRKRCAAAVLAAVRGLHRLERDAGQLAGALVRARARLRRDQLWLGRGPRQAEDQQARRQAPTARRCRARCRCRRRSARRVHSTIDGRSRLSSAAASASQPNDVRREQRDRGCGGCARARCSPAVAGDADRGCSITW